MMLHVPCEAEKFKGRFSSVNALSSLDFSVNTLLWAAVTVGRENPQEVLCFGLASVLEVVYRAAIVGANLRAGESGWLERSAAYAALDPSEKGAVSYFLGLTMAKLFAALHLSAPWIMHLDVYKKKFDVKLDSKSRPDLIGVIGEQHDGQRLATESREWMVLEAKGRTNEYESDLLATAREQTKHVKMIDGDTPALRVAAVSYFRSDRFAFKTCDPEPDRRQEPANLRISRDDFLEDYYRLLRDLLTHSAVYRRDQDGERFLVCYLDCIDLTLGLAERWLGDDLLIKLREVGPARTSRRRAEEPAHVGGDGVLVETGESWVPESSRL